MNTDNSYNFTQSESTVFDNDYSFCRREVLHIDQILFENIQSLNSVSKSIVFPISRPICLINQVSNYFEEIEDVVSQVRTFIPQKGSCKEKNNKNIQKEIKQLKEDVDRISKEIDKLKTEKERVKSIGGSYEKALNYYSTNFGFNIEVESEVDDNKYWIKLYFRDKQQFPLKFLINYKSNTVEDFNTQALLSHEEEVALKNKYQNDQDICMVLKSLRNLVLNKN